MCAVLRRLAIATVSPLPHHNLVHLCHGQLHHRRGRPTWPGDPHVAARWDCPTLLACTPRPQRRFIQGSMPLARLNSPQTLARVHTVCHGVTHPLKMTIPEPTQKFSTAGRNPNSRKLSAKQLASTLTIPSDTVNILIRPPMFSRHLFPSDAPPSFAWP